MKHLIYQPPSEIDGARIVEWAWSGDIPFGEISGAPSPEIFGLAIATYDGEQFYRFSCDRNWETQQDGSYDSLLAAKQQLPDPYRSVEVNWIKA